MDRLLSLRWPPALAVLFCALLGTLLPAAFGVVAGVAEPVVHDEFSYLLGADTFAHGRLANPSPVLPEFFESPHVLVVPTYASKYPPGQAIFLALGQDLGHPIRGVWLSCGLFAASLCWMLQGWTSRRWALAVSLLSIVTLGISTYWAQSYWGGMVAAAGSALLLGGLRRTLRAPRVSASVAMAIGILMLANTRPFEGLLLSIPIALVSGAWLVRSGRWSLEAKVTRFVLPCGIALIAGAAWVAHYNNAVTGSPWSTPYAVHQRQYFSQGVFLSSAVRAPERRPAARVAGFYDSHTLEPPTGRRLIGTVSMRAIGRFMGSISAGLGLVVPISRGGREPYRGALLWIALLAAVAARRTPRSVWLVGSAAAIVELLAWRFVPVHPIALWIPVTLIWVAAFVALARPTMWRSLMVSTVLAVVLGASIVPGWLSHYAAPIVPVVLAGVAVVVRRVSQRFPAGRSSLPVAAVLLTFFVVQCATMGVLYSSSIGAGPAPRDLALGRAEVEAQLLERGGRHLVFVRYSPEVSPHVEWVYNGADLSSASVVFAHDLGHSRNPKLIAAFPGRSVWTASVSRQAIRLNPYAASDE